MNKVICFLLFGSLLFSFGSGAEWVKISPSSVDAVVVSSYTEIEGGVPSSDVVKVFVAGVDTKDLYRYFEERDRWMKISDPVEDFVAAGGKLYRLDESGEVWRYMGTPPPENRPTWQKIWGGPSDVPSLGPFQGPAAKIYGGGNELYAVSLDQNELYRYEGSPHSWEEIGHGGFENRVEFAAGGGFLGPTQVPSTIYQLNTPPRDYVSFYSATTGEWESIRGDLPIYDIYGEGYNLGALFGTDETGDLYMYEGGTDEWRRISGPGRSFVATQFGCPSGDCKNVLYRLTLDGTEIWKYSYLNPGAPGVQIPTSGFREIREIHAGGGELYAVTAHGNLYKYTG